ncbi:MAG: hypothetical protein ACRD2F_07105 [Terriglobales bacterium]
MAVESSPEREGRQVPLPSGADPERSGGPRGETRRWLAIAAYGGLLILTFATITDRRILWVTVSVLLVLMVLTLFRHEAEGIPAPWRRAADVSLETPEGAPVHPPARGEWGGERS